MHHAISMARAVPTIRTTKPKSDWPAVGDMLMAVMMTAQKARFSTDHFWVWWMKIGSESDIVASAARSPNADSGDLRKLERVRNPLPMRSNQFVGGGCSGSFLS